MKQNIYNLSLLTMMLSGLLLLSISSCSDSNDAVAGKSESNASDIILPLGISSVSSGTSQQTRGAITELDHSATIGFYVKAPDFNEDGSVSYTEYGNVAGRYNVDNNLWMPDTSIYLSNKNAKMTVYSPYDAQQSRDSLLLTAALAATDGSNDIIAKTIDVNNQSVANGLSVTLSHLYTCLQFSFVKNDDFASSELIIEQLQLDGDDIYAEGCYDPYDGSYGPSLKGKEDVSLSVPDLTIPAAAEVAGGKVKPAVVRTLLIPINHVFTEDANLWITLKKTATANAKRIGVKIPKETFTATQPFAPNKQYNFNIKVSPVEGMIIDGVEIEDWTLYSSEQGDFQID